MSLSNGGFRLPVDVRPIWGKLGNGSWPHPLICHALDTAEVASQLFDLCLGPYLKNRLEAALEPLGDAREWAARLAGLHDLGKCSPTFQGLRADVSKTLLPESDHAAIDRLREGPRSSGARTDVAHGLITALYVRNLLVKWGASVETAESIGVVLGAHHGYVPGPADLRQVSYKRGAIGGETWATRVEALADELCRLRRTSKSEPSAADWARVTMDGPAEVALAALTSVSDWIASDRREAAHAGPAIDLAAYAAGSRAVHDGHVDDVLEGHPWLETHPAPLRRARERLDAGTPLHLRTVRDTVPVFVGAELRHDHPISFSARRRHGTRAVRVGHVPLTAPMLPRQPEATSKSEQVGTA